MKLRRNEIKELFARRIRYDMSYRLKTAIRNVAVDKEYDKRFSEILNTHYGWSYADYEYYQGEIEEAFSELVSKEMSQVKLGIARITSCKYALWSISFDADFLQIDYDGDFRILDWEQNNLDEEGKYTGIPKYEYEKEGECLKVGL